MRLFHLQFTTLNRFQLPWFWAQGFGWGLFFLIWHFSYPHILGVFSKKFSCWYFVSCMGFGILGLLHVCFWDLGAYLIFFFLSTYNSLNGTSEIYGSEPWVNSIYVYMISWYYKWSCSGVCFFVPSLRSFSVYLIELLSTTYFKVFSLLCRWLCISGQGLFKCNWPPAGCPHSWIIVESNVWKQSLQPIPPQIKFLLKSSNRKPSWTENSSPVCVGHSHEYIFLIGSQGSNLPRPPDECTLFLSLCTSPSRLKQPLGPCAICSSQRVWIPID